jgi:hypothetical protein
MQKGQEGFPPEENTKEQAKPARRDQTVRRSWVAREWVKGAGKRVRDRCATALKSAQGVRGPLQAPGVGFIQPVSD